MSKCLRRVAGSLFVVFFTAVYVFNHVWKQPIYSNTAYVVVILCFDDLYSFLYDAEAFERAGIERLYKGMKNPCVPHESALQGLFGVSIYLLL
ncbi:hypothetical protein [Paenibacillus agricola]|uniref:hypothetical protein n=1 Tax=Paenibacillus agricola TaxID=2716264 RepID=UPI001FB743A9|nr:hypothetical protein [Paenibacillus agricola]